jgi:DNA-binding IclR family transcriptional regulator
MTALSPDVVEFAAAHIQTIQDLQILVMCIDHPERWWDAVAVARHLRITRSGARRALDRLARANLLDIRITGDVRYQFKPGSAALEQAALACAAAYRAVPAAMAELIAGLPRHAT